MAEAAFKSRSPFPILKNSSILGLLLSSIKKLYLFNYIIFVLYLQKLVRNGKYVR
jgi:hypothetical protein